MSITFTSKEATIQGQVYLPNATIFKLSMDGQMIVWVVDVRMYMFMFLDIGVMIFTLVTRSQGS